MLCVCVYTLEADIFSGIPRVTGIKIATNHVIGTGQEKIIIGSGRDRE